MAGPDRPRPERGHHDEPTSDADVADLGVIRLGDSLEQYVNHLGAPPISVLTQLHDRWPEIVGPGLAAATRPIELVNGELAVGCQDAAWASQIGWMEGQIITRFRAMFGAVDLRRVVARVSPAGQDDPADSGR